MTHIPVLLSSVLDGTQLRAGDVVIDCTFGGGGYTRAFLAATEPDGRVLAIDQDPDAIARGERLDWVLAASSRLILAHAHFTAVADVVRRFDLPAPRAIVADLGYSSFQLADAHRGFSFLTNGPLDMRFDPTSSERSAAELLASAAPRELEYMLRMYGEERHARAIALAIVEYRTKEPIKETQQLVSIVEHVVPRRGRIHPATRTFQALRIAVNDELDALARAIPIFFELVAPGGRIAMVSFHSLEDRIVKRAFRKAAETSWGTIVTKRPVVPGRAEIAENARSRSAKLRIIERNS